MSLAGPRCIPVCIAYLSEHLTYQNTQMPESGLLAERAFQSNMVRANINACQVNRATETVQTCMDYPPRGSPQLLMIQEGESLVVPIEPGRRESQSARRILSGFGAGRSERLPPSITTALG